MEILALQLLVGSRREVTTENKRLLASESQQAHPELLNRIAPPLKGLVMANYQRASLGNIKSLGRITLHNELGLTGTEVSINELPAGVSVPFVHAHQQNEEVYLILSGKGQFYLDGEELDVAEGDALRIDPAAKRCIKAVADSALRFVCIQAKANSLMQFTENDGVPADGKPSWL